MVLAEKNKIIRSLFLSFWLLGGIVLSSCGEDDRLGVAGSIDSSRMPQLSTRNVSTLISDSGYTKYKVVTPLWNVYGNNKEENYWCFPEGVYLRQLDKNLQVVSTVAADSAVYFPNRKLWELYGDVEIDQKDKAYFFSQRIFFDDRQKLIYSDTFIHIKTPTQILEGIGFESNQSLTKYRVIKPTGMFPTNQLEGDGPRADGSFGSGTPSAAMTQQPVSIQPEQNDN